MPKPARLLSAHLLAALLLAGLPAAAQDLSLPAASPQAEATQTVGVTPLTVRYNSPGKKGRTVFGELVPHQKLWRTGANAATTLETAHPIKLGDKDVPAGKYALLTIPDPAGWTIILNRNAALSGTRGYDEKLDAARITVKPTTIPARERLSFIFSDTTDTATHLDLEWDTTRVRIPITVDTPALVGASLKTFQSKTASSLASAGRHLASTGDLKGASQLFDASLATERTWFNVWLKADLLAKQGNHKAAYPLAEEAYALGKQADYFFWEQQVAQALKDWKGKR